jgi:type II secretion system protein J
MTGRRPTFRAFTLLEVLIATALVAVLAGSLYASLSIAFRSQRVAQKAVGPTRTADLTMELVAEDLRSAVVPNGVIAGTFVGVDSTGDNGHEADDLVFCTTNPSPEPDEGIGDVKKVEFVCENAEDGRSQILVRLITSNLLAPLTLEPQREVICRDVYSFNLRYFDGSDWLDTWDSTAENNVLPTAVEVTLQLVDPAAPDANTGGYLRSQVFMIPCGPPPTGGVAFTTTSASTGARTGP